MYLPYTLSSDLPVCSIQGSNVPLVALRRLHYGGMQRMALHYAMLVASGEQLLILSQWPSSCLLLSPYTPQVSFPTFRWLLGGISLTVCFHNLFVQICTASADILLPFPPCIALIMMGLSGKRQCEILHWSFVLHWLPITGTRSIACAAPIAGTFPRRTPRFTPTAGIVVICWNWPSSSTKCGDDAKKSGS